MNYEVKDFQKDVIERSKNIPVLVDFWAEWCGPCKMLGPILERLAEKYKDTWALAKLDTDGNQEIAMEYGIRGIPNVKLFVNGEVTDEFTGALPENMVEQWLKKAIPSKNQEQLESAKILFSEHRNDDAKKILQNFLAVEPENEEAKLLLGKILVFEDSDKAINLVQNVDGSAENYEQVESIQTIYVLLKKLNQLDKLPDAPVKNNYVSAIENLKTKNFDSALEKFIDVIREDKTYDDEGARKACIAIFKYLGEENETTLKHRKDFGRALYI
ncbi:MAG: thioredoxin [Ignavibacteriaceae bacterium]